MKFIKMSELSFEEQSRVQWVFGFHQQRPDLVAQKKGDHEWIIFKNVEQSRQKKIVLKKFDQLFSLGEVLVYFHKKGLDPFCQYKGGEKPSTIRPKPSHILSDKPKAPENKPENREYFRKKVHLYGQYTNPNTGLSGNLIVKDISLKGVKISIPGFENLINGDKLFISFTLDDTKQNEIKQEVTVRHVGKNHIGAEFTSQAEFEKELGFYLFN